jgi:RNA polymerase sigma-70 factor (ECF subfamily)
MNGPDAEIQFLSDEQLASQTQAGSMAAFEELVARYERRIYAFVKQSCRSDADARDLTQGTFVRAYQAIAKFDSRRPFAAWLFTIARHLCVDHHRAALPPAGPMPDEADLNDPAELLAQHEERGGLWRLARCHLPELQFRALWLRYAADLDIEEVADVLGKTRTHIKVLLFRARSALGAELKTAGSRRVSERVGRPMRENPAPKRPTHHVSRVTHHASRITPLSRLTYEILDR